ncbi:MAG: ABC transporter substrate-binding protein [Chloroflexota bacterium]|nr:ABC transporter substrate-binding protein [Chloroflexota bacterium]
MIAATTPRRGVRQGLGALAGLGALYAALAAPAAQAHTVGQAPTASTSGGSIVIVNPVGTPDCLDPQKTALGSSFYVFSSVVDPLFSTDESGHIRPDLATSYTYGVGGTTLTVSLRHGVRFSNGDPFDASAVKYTFDRALNPATKSPATAASLAALKSTQVVNPYTVRLVLKTPYRPLLTQLAIAYEGILDPKAPPTCQAPIGTGPFKIQSVGPGFSSVTVVRNPYHTFETPWARNRGPAYLDKIVFNSIVSNATSVSDLLSGGADISTILGTQLNRVHGNAGIAQHKIPTQGEDYLGYNTAHTPFNQVAVRRAVAQAIDRKAVVTGAFSGLATPAYSPIPTTLPFYDKAAPGYAPQYDIAAAQKALAGTNAAHGRYTLLVPSEQPLPQAAELIQAELGQVGINVSIVTKPLGDFIPLAAKGQYDLLLLGWGYPDPDFLYQLLDSSQGAGAGLNFTNYKSATLDSLIVKGRTATDNGQAATAYAQLQRFVDTNVIIDPLVTPAAIYGVRTRVKGWHTSSDTSILYQDLYVAS